MLPVSDWRSSSAADKLVQLDQEQFAFEFLRRNPAYEEDYKNTQARIASGSLSLDSGMSRLARRWGLSFCACARHSRLGCTCLVAAGVFAGQCDRCART